MAMWNPFKKRSPADVHSVMVKNPETGLNEVHLIITVGELAEAGNTLAECFDAVVSRHRSNPDFGGQLVFLVRGPVPGTELSRELVQAQLQLEAKVAGLSTAKGLPFRARVEYKQSAW
jgi:hypothetical protein